MTREEARLGMLVNTIAGAGVIVTLCCDAGASYADPCADTATVRLGPQWWMDFALSSLTANRITLDELNRVTLECLRGSGIAETFFSHAENLNWLKYGCVRGPGYMTLNNFCGRTPSARTGAIPSGSAGTLSDGAPL